MLVKLSYVHSLIISSTQSAWSESEKFCADHNGHLIPPEPFMTVGRLDGDICDLAVGDKVWIFGVTYLLECNEGKCQNIEVTIQPSKTELDFFCQQSNGVMYASGSINKAYHLAMSGCGPKQQGWPRLANLSTDLSSIKKSINSGHIKENQLYWVQDFLLNSRNRTCKVLQRTNQSFAQIISTPCNKLAKAACRTGTGHFQKAVRYFLSDGNQHDSILQLNCSETDIDFTATEPRYIDYVDDDVSDDVVPGEKPTDGNFSSNSSGNSNNATTTDADIWDNKTLYFIICGAASGCVFLLVAIVMVIACCVRTRVEVLPYGEPKDLIRKGSSYKYENPYDTRKHFEKVIKIKALKKEDSTNYDYPDVVIDTKKSEISSNTYDEIMSTKSPGGGISVRTPGTGNCAKNVLLPDDNMASNSSTNVYTYIDVKEEPKFENTHLDTNSNKPIDVNIENSRTSKEPIYL